MPHNAWCDALNIDVPSLEAVKDHREAKVYTLLIVALLERGRAMTLEEVAERFAEAGIAPTPKALRSLKRCRPARPPVYRDGDTYYLDAWDDETDLLLFTIGLRPPLVPPVEVVRPEPAPVPGPDVSLAPDELDEALSFRSGYHASARSLALAILDAYGPSSGEEIERLVHRHTGSESFDMSAPHLRNRGSPLRRLEDGRWNIAGGADEQVRKARRWVRGELEKRRARPPGPFDPAVVAARESALARRKERRAAELAALSRAIFVAFPRDEPRAVALVDVRTRDVASFEGEELAEARKRLASYDLVAAEAVHSSCRTIGLDPDRRRLAELGPSQEKVEVGGRRKPLRLTTADLVEGSCGAGHLYGKDQALRRHLDRGRLDLLRRALESRVQALHAYYQYGRLHHAVRVRKRQLDEQIPVRWADECEPSLIDITLDAFLNRKPLELIVGAAPDWEDPWARARRAVAAGDDGTGGVVLVDDEGDVVDPWTVQAMRVVGDG